MHSPTPPTSPRTPSRRRHWSRRRKRALTLIALILVIPIGFAVWYAQSITDAINDAQDAAVHDLPTHRSYIDSASPQASPGPLANVTDSANDVAEPTATAGQQRTSSYDVARGLFEARGGADEREIDEVWPDTKYLTIMVLGVDRRSNGSDQNADVIILARLDLDNRTLNSVSLPRDLQVEVPGHGLHKINGAYNIGIQENPDDPVAGAAMMRDTIEANFGVLIDDYVLIDFDGFEDVIDAVGGIDINVPERIEDPEYPTENNETRLLTIEAGRQHMNGDTALAYARTRHQDNDDQRRERQMLVLRSLLERIQSIGSLTRLTSIISTLGESGMTSFRWEEQLALASMALDFEQPHIRMANLGEPLVTPGTAADGAWVYIGDQDELGAYIEGILSGKTAP